MADHQPYHAVLSVQKYMPNAITPEVIEEFYETGRQYIDGVFTNSINPIKGTDWKPNRSLEFGCGVSRLLIPIARRSGSAVGIDIANNMIELSKRRAESEGLANITFYNTVDAMPAQDFDFIFSAIVFQHIPPIRGLPIISKLCRILNREGVISIQLTFAKTVKWAEHSLSHLELHSDDGLKITPLVENTQLHSVKMSMYDYDLNAVFANLFSNQIIIRKLEWTDHGGCIGVNILGCRIG
jgi:ubiquinone/menaquinone biosynthesis C-methylase UbiE